MNRLTEKEKDEIVRRAFKSIAMVFTENKVEPTKELWGIAISVYQRAVDDYVRSGTEARGGK